MAYQRSSSALINSLLIATSLLLLGAFPVSAYPQSVTFAGVQTTVPASGLLQPFGVAVDGAGDVFIGDMGHDRVVEVPVGCMISACQTTVGVGLNQPAGVV